MSCGRFAGGSGSGVSQIISGARPFCDAPTHRQDGLAGGASAFLGIPSPSATFVVVVVFGASFVHLRRLFRSPERNPCRREARPVCSKCGASAPGGAIGERRGSTATLLPIIISIGSLTFAAFKHVEVASLQEEIINLHRLCNGYHSGSNYSGIGELLAGDNFDLSFSGPVGGSIALYSVLFMLPLFYVLFKYGGNFLKIENAFITSKNREVVPLKKRLAYKADVFFSVYPYAKLLALLLATILLIGSGGLALHAVSNNSLSEAFWLSWTFLADSGAHADQVGLGPRVVSIVISSGGMMIFALMLGLVSEAISEKVDSLRKGKSEVIEMDHILVLGWSDKLGPLLKQLARANNSFGGGVVVVLAERDKEEMEIDISKMELDYLGTSVICRSGSPLIMADLKKVSVSKARAVIVMATDEGADQSDARALRVVLSLAGVKEALRGHVVVEMCDLDNEHLVKLVGGEFIETIVSHDVIGRLMIQCAMQPGLAQIWEDFLGFENDEFYIQRWPELDGKHFKDVLISFSDAIPCGVKVAARNGELILNPDDDYILQKGDEILVIAEDDHTYSPGPLPKIRQGSRPIVSSPPKFPQKILFCGWRRDIDDMIMILETFLPEESELWIFSELPDHEREKKLSDAQLDLAGLKNIKIVHKHGNCVIRRHLEDLPLESFDSILILADESFEDSIVHSDSRSLATLLLIRDIQCKRLPGGGKKRALVRRAGFSHSSWIREIQEASSRSMIISEILDSGTRHLVSVSRISDYVLSNELVSMALAMVAEDRQINQVLAELFSQEGNEMYIRPAEYYVDDQEELSFYDIMVRGRQRREIVIGYRLASAARALINPPKKLESRKWSRNDIFVVFAHEE